MTETSPRPAELASIITRLEERLGAMTGGPRPLDGGITNHNYRVTLGGEDFVVRLPGKDTELLGISREAERLAGEAAARLGISPEPVAALPECSVTRFVTCAAVPAKDLRSAPEEIARVLRRFHDRGPRLPVRFDVPALIDDYAAVVRSHGRELPASYPAAASVATAIADAVGDPTPPAPCHNDLLAANVIRARAGAAAGRLMLVDWEYAGMGDPFFDLGNLSVNNGFDDGADERLLAAYLGAEPDRRSRARLGLMRAMSDAREAAWGVVQGAVSRLDFDFGAYAAEHFDRLRAAVAGPSFAGWLDDARS